MFLWNRWLAFIRINYHVCEYYYLWIHLLYQWQIKKGYEQQFVSKWTNDFYGQSFVPIITNSAYDQQFINTGTNYASDQQFVSTYMKNRIILLSYYPLSHQNLHTHSGYFHALSVTHSILTGTLTRTKYDYVYVTG